MSKLWQGIFKELNMLILNLYKIVRVQDSWANLEKGEQRRGLHPPRKNQCETGAGKVKQIREKIKRIRNRCKST